MSNPNSVRHNTKLVGTISECLQLFLTLHFDHKHLAQSLQRVDDRRDGGLSWWEGGRDKVEEGIE